ncbi:MAG: DUF1631 family protein [Gammaproteobacteria bacterium]|nr:DUF1631 family protein [Gammaproteobacteria bacterium]
MSAEILSLKTGEQDSTESSRNSSEYDYDALLESVFNRLSVQLLQKVSLMLNNADSSLNAITEKEEEGLKSQCVELVQSLRVERGSIDNAFLTAINDKIDDEEKAQDNELSLIDDDEMEEMVAISSMYSNAMNLYGQEVNNLQARFEYLELSCNHKLSKKLLDPRHICEAFQTALKQLDLALELKLLMFKLFDIEVNSRLGEMYKSLNQLFINAGIMPEIVYQARNLDPDNAVDENKNQQDIDGISVRQAKYYDPQNNKAENFIPRSNDEISYFISQFMNGFTTATGEGIPDSFSMIPTDKDNHNCYSRKELMTSLSKLQSKFINSKKAFDKIGAEQIKRAIIADMGSRNGGAVTKKVHTLDERSIDFVGMMFSAITKDESISSVINNLLMRLQIPVIKVAMLDESLFSNEQHPARETLDLISQAGKGITAKENEVYNQLNNIVNGILQKYNIDIASFERAADALHKLIKSEQEMAAENERTEQREIIRQHARNVVLTEMRYLTSNKKLPKNVQPLILKHYPTMMCKRYIKHGKESSEWLLSVMLLKLLMKCLQPVNTKQQWTMLKHNYQPLIEAVNDELYETQQDRAEIDAQISALKQTFLKMLDEYGFKLVETSKSAQQPTNSMPYVEEQNITAANEEFATGEHDKETARIKEQARIARDKISRLPSSLHPGVWFEIFNGEDKPVRRLKLSVVLTEVARLIFVDCHGVKVIEKDAGDFANELANQRSKPIADHSTFEHALGAVIHKLAA